MRSAFGIVQYQKHKCEADAPATESAGSVNAALRGCYPLPMRYIFVLQTGQAPLVAGLPFFIVTGFGSFMSRCVRHFRQ
jgi:hypothetical protein